MSSSEFQSPGRDMPMNPATVWPFVEAGCSAAEVAVWFGVSTDGAIYAIWRTKDVFSRMAA